MKPPTEGMGPDRTRGAPVQDDGDGHLAAAVIERAMVDMRRRTCTEAERRQAILWLASRQATRWFDGLGLDQQVLLQGMGWAEHARALLREGGLAEHERRLLADGLAAVQPTGRGQGCDG